VCPDDLVVRSRLLAGPSPAVGTVPVGHRRSFSQGGQRSGAVAPGESH
jgi:hypothetical protein